MISTLSWRLTRSREASSTCRSGPAGSVGAAGMGGVGVGATGVGTGAAGGATGAAGLTAAGPAGRVSVGTLGAAPHPTSRAQPTSSRTVIFDTLLDIGTS
ncbi:hypothetical protein DM785_15205 [Deinococcus actinosclerus]|nr:hypothetical protein DM785_15205 [Deinococcus actinosclerus]